MLRSLLARPRPLISHLRRPDYRPVARQLARRADQIISRSYTSSSSEDETADSDVDHRETRHMRKHLYVVLDDWRKGFSIHKLDLDDGSDGGDLTLQAPVHRQSTADSKWNFAAVGSKIVAAGMIKPIEDDYVTLVYDTETAGLSIVPRLPGGLQYGWRLAIAAGNRLYTFETVDYRRLPNGFMHLLEDAPAPAGCDKNWWGNSDHWSWSSVPTAFPFKIGDVESIAVHPDGGGRRTFFVSTRDRNETVDIEDNQDPCVDQASTNNISIGTSGAFAYDTGTSEWRRHGDWDLPFYGQAHYDAELDVWVGLHKAYERDGLHDYHTTDGYLCSCDVASPNGRPVRPVWKLCAERLFDRHTGRHIQASLVYMGGSTYCLVEFMELERFKNRRCIDVGHNCAIRVATFRLKYGKKGELLITDRQPDCSYHFSRFNVNVERQAFWM